ncbi:hypothetical protein FPQ18DRAFT_308486 [Pyronema domesticum]|nr:hypothetical protein FPQ18DRAFT_308486 [Pyronema domesticum]
MSDLITRFQPGAPHQIRCKLSPRDQGHSCNQWFSNVDVAKPKQDGQSAYVSIFTIYGREVKIDGLSPQACILLHRIGSMSLNHNIHINCWYTPEYVRYMALFFKAFLDHHERVDFVKCDYSTPHAFDPKQGLWGSMELFQSNTIGKFHDAEKEFASQLEDLFDHVSYCMPEEIKLELITALRNENCFNMKTPTWNPYLCSMFGLEKVWDHRRNYHGWRMERENCSSAEVCECQNVNNGCKDKSCHWYEGWEMTESAVEIEEQEKILDKRRREWVKM